MSDLIWIQTVGHSDDIEKSSVQRVKYGTIINCEGVVKQYTKTEKLFRKYVIFEPHRLCFKLMTYICSHSTFLLANGYNG